MNYRMKIGESTIECDTADEAIAMAGSMPTKKCVGSMPYNPLNRWQKAAITRRRHTKEKLLAQLETKQVLPSNNRKHKPWTEAENRELQKMYAANWKWKAVARALGRTRLACRHQMFNINHNLQHKANGKTNGVQA